MPSGRRKSSRRSLWAEALEVRHLSTIGFQPATSYAAEGSPHSVAVGDFNGDGKPDSVVAGGGNVFVFLNNGKGAFQSAEGYSVSGLGSFQGVDEVGVGNFNGDDHLDLVATVSQGHFAVFPGRGDGTFQPPIVTSTTLGQTGAFAVGDFTGDGVDDVVIPQFQFSPTTSSLFLLAGQIDGTFRGPTLIDSTPGYSGPAPVVGDFNRDGKPDLLEPDSNAGTVNVLLGNGDGTFRRAASLPIGYGEPSGSPSLFSVVTGDFNGDGLADFATAATISGTGSVFLGNGDGTFRGPSLVALDRADVGVFSGFQLAAGDFDGDGHVDLAVLLLSNPEVRVLPGRGDGTFGPPQIFPLSGQTSSLAAADLTGNGAADLIITQTQPGALLVLLNQVGPSPPLTGSLNPSSDRGASPGDGITDVRQPNFLGKAAPNALVQVFAQRSDQATPVLVGAAFADASGSWSVTTAPLADGTYTVTAVASVSPDQTSPAVPLLPAAGVGPLVIDTVGPRITGVVVQPHLGRILISYRDDRSGLDPAGLSNPSSYDVTRPFSRRRVSLRVASVMPVPSNPQAVALLLDNRAQLRHGRFLLKVRSARIEDVAGNALDGEFLGTFPSGDGQPGGNFRARIDVAAHHVSRPRPAGLRHVIRPHGVG